MGKMIGGENIYLMRSYAGEKHILEKDSSIEKK